MAEYSPHNWSLRVEPDARALRASNLTDEAKTDGIQPGESIEAVLSHFWEPETERKPIGTAPQEPGTYSFEWKGITTQYTVEEGESRDVATNPDEVIDVSSAEGTQGVKRDDASTSRSSRLVADGGEPTDGASSSSDGSQTILAALTGGPIVPVLLIAAGYLLYRWLS